MSKKKTTANVPEVVEDPEADQSKLCELIETLRQMLKEEKNLIVRTDDNFMLRFLRWQNYDPQAAFTKIRDWYQFKAATFEWFSRGHPTEYDHIMNKQIHYMLPDRDSRGRRVYIVKIGNMDRSQMSLIDLIHEDMLWLETAVEEEDTQKNGIAIIVDLANISYSTMKWLTPAHTRLGTMLMESLALRSIDYYVVNTSMFMNVAIAIVFPFLSQKTKDHVHFQYRDWPLLHKHINPEILPGEYGGQKLNMDIQKLKSYVYNNSDKLVEACSYGYVKET